VIVQQIFGQSQVWPSSTSLNAGFLVMSLTLTCLHRNDKVIGLAWFMNRGRGQFRGRPVARFVPNPKLKFLDQCHEVMRFKQLAARTEETYLQWIRRFILFHRREGDDRSGHWRSSPCQLEMGLAASRGHGKAGGAGISDGPCGEAQRQRGDPESGVERLAILEHKDVRTTQIYTHVMKKPGMGVKSPLDSI
jgi:hypothetical protein